MSLAPAVTASFLMFAMDSLLPSTLCFYSYFIEAASEYWRDMDTVAQDVEEALGGQKRCAAFGLDFDLKTHSATVPLMGRVERHAQAKSRRTGFKRGALSFSV
eukprot:4081222-Amphidinium_carterae.1